MSMSSEGLTSAEYTGIIGHYLRDNGQRKKIVDVLDHQPVDMSVGIRIGTMTVATSDGCTYDLDTMGKVYKWDTPEDPGEAKCVHTSGNVYEKLYND